MTKGEYRVGISFNPSNDYTVGRIKRAAAKLIDLIDALPVPDSGKSADYAVEVVRLKALAQTEIESAAMWAVKAATKPAKEVEMVDGLEQPSIGKGSTKAQPNIEDII